MSSSLPRPAETPDGRLFDDAFLVRLEHARAAAAAALLRERNDAGWWTGELSASALSTATAVTALSFYARGSPSAADRLREPIRQGYAWLIRYQNTDGGWGDTTASFSNISTTTLVWAAFGVGRELPPGAEQAVSGAERWLTQAAGSLEPRRLVRAIEARYGKDRTFSIPILTMCALCGRLGPEQDGWRHVRQLPFEVAALPQRWFGALQLPVVSYALPALIAIGQVRHGMRPTRNPVFRALRDRCRARTLEKLVRLQPDNGGFLEATPLTSFVTMSLAALGLTEHPVVQRGVAFIETSAREDGSWPIDSNLATWLTTLSVNALMHPGMANVSERPAFQSPAAVAAGGEGALPPGDHRRTIRDWLVGQQHRIEHPYTLAAPGGWAWTDLPGGVPDADDTAGALLALRRLVPAETGSVQRPEPTAGDPAPLESEDPALRDAVQAGVTWLLNLQNRDGGIPTFCRGWGRLPFDRSSPDLTAHAIRAWLAWRAELPASLQRKASAAIARAAGFLEKNQRSDGAWVPLWFGHQEGVDEENPLYGTARVVPALCSWEEAGARGVGGPLDRAIAWIVSKQNSDGGWCGATGAASSMEETGAALEALAVAWERKAGDPVARAALRTAIGRGARWLVAAVERGQWQHPAPIGLYFAKLWYHERLYPLIFATGALTRVTALGIRRSVLAAAPQRILSVGRIDIA